MLSEANKVKLVIFDLDGTLIDTAPDLAYSMDLVMQELGLPEQGVSKVRRHIGNGVRRLVEDVMISELQSTPDQEAVDEALDAFIGHYHEHLVRQSCLYPDVRNCLQGLRSSGIRLACVTNKAKAFTEPLLAHFQIDEYFDLVLSGDSLAKKKPDPFPLVHACQQFEVKAADCIMVGDSSNDIRAARDAGIRSVCMSYGYSDAEAIKMLKPDVVLGSCAELMEFL